MSRGIIEAQTLRTEQFEFEARTSDPADAQPGEYWIRTDQTNTNPDIIAQLRRQDNSGVTTCPIFAAAEESNLGGDVVRGPSVVLDGGSVGFVAMTTKAGAVGSPRAVTSAGAQYVSHNALELATIPDSVVSRPDDDNSVSDGRKLGIEFESTLSWPANEIEFRLSQNIAGQTTAYILDDQSNVLANTDISGLSALDVFTLNQEIVENTTYQIAVDAGGASYTPGFLQSPSYPYTSADGVLSITGDARVGGAGGQAFNILEIGNLTN